MAGDPDQGPTWPAQGAYRGLLEPGPARTNPRAPAPDGGPTRGGDQAAAVAPQALPACGPDAPPAFVAGRNDGVNRGPVAIKPRDWELNLGQYRELPGVPPYRTDGPAAERRSEALRGAMDFEAFAPASFARRPATAGENCILEDGAPTSSLAPGTRTRLGAGRAATPGTTVRTGADRGIG